MKRTVIAAIIIIVLIGLGYVFLKKSSNQPVSQQNSQTQQAPNTQNPQFAQFEAIPSESVLKDNLQKAGLDALTAEGTTEHIHQHLDIVIQGQNVVVPADIGIGTTFISPIHTHDETGVLHVESPVVKDFKLGQFFDEWGIKFDNSCIGTFCADQNSQLVMAVNGTPVQNPRDYVLKAHDEIEVWYGPKSEQPKFISSYQFAEGL